jgi:hypothetical protein
LRTAVTLLAAFSVLAWALSIGCLVTSSGGPALFWSIAAAVNGVCLLEVLGNAYRVWTRRPAATAGR